MTWDIFGQGSRELAQAIQDCLNRLPDDMRLVAVMCDVQGMDYAEIAEAVGTAWTRG